MIKKIILSLLLVFTLSACSELELGSHVAKQMKFPGDTKQTVGDFKVGNPYKIKGRTYYPAEKYSHSEVGVASWYGPGFHGKQTANGEIFNRYELTAAHRTLQMPSIVRVTNLENGRSIIVRVNDRGPFAHNRVIDLSEKAAETLGMKTKGTARVRVDVLEKESRMVASAAKQGRSTRGTELAFNRGHHIKGMEVQIAKPSIKPIESGQKPIMTAQANIPERRMFNEIITDQMSPVTHVRTKPVQKVVIEDRPQDIARKPITSVPHTYQPVYVQAGAFKSEDNAMTMKMALYNIKEPVDIYRFVEKGEPVYKVKIGPLASIEKADEILKLLNQQGRDARMVVAQNH